MSNETQLTEQAEQLTALIRQLTNQPRTPVTSYKISALTLAVTYITEAAAVINAMTETINKYERNE